MPDQPPVSNQVNPEHAVILQELTRRRDTLSPQQQAALDELTRRAGGGAPKETPYVTSTVTPSGSPGGNFMQGMWDELPNLRKVFEGTQQALTFPGQTLAALGDKQAEMLRKADGAMDKGEYLKALRHAIEFAIPVLGPAMSEMGDEAEQGKVAHALGRATTFGLMNVLPGPALSGRQIIKGITNPNTVVRGAYDYLASKGVPIPAGRRSGNTALMTTQEAAEQTFGGSRIAQDTEAKQVAALTAESQRLANEAHPTATTALSAGEDVSRALQGNSDAIAAGLGQDADGLAKRVHPQPIVPLQAGTDLRAAAEGRVQTLGREADIAYDPFHQAARDPKNSRKILVGTNDKGRGIYEQMGMPVPVTQLQTILRPLVREWEMLVEPAKRNSSRGFTAMESILAWKKGGYMPAELAEKALGGLKDLVRQGKYETKGGEAFARAMRDENQGVAALAIAELQKSIDAAAAGAGPDAIKALQDGRKLTAQRFDVADNVVSKMQQEPVNTYGQMVYGGDSGINHASRVAQEVPGELPKVARAFFGELTGKASTPGGWKAAKREWDALGAETKKMLYGDPKLRSEIDAFFHAGVEHAETDIMRDIAHEPVAVYKRMTQPEDARIAFLEKVHDIAPTEVQKVGRAYLEELFDKATREGGWTRAQGVFRDWEKLGDKTKELLFPNPLHRADLDKFFLGVKKLSEPMNPSRTAMALVNIGEKGLWITGLSGAGTALATGNPLMAAGAIATPAAVSFSGRQIAKLLHSPAGTKLLLDGMRMPAGKSGYAAATATKLLELAGDAEEKKNGR